MLDWMLARTRFSRHNIPRVSAPLWLGGDKAALLLSELIFGARSELLVGAWCRIGHYQLMSRRVTWLILPDPCWSFLTCCASCIADLFTIDELSERTPADVATGDVAHPWYWYLDFYHLYTQMTEKFSTATATADVATGDVVHPCFAYCYWCIILLSLPCRSRLSVTTGKSTGLTYKHLRSFRNLANLRLTTFDAMWMNKLAFWNALFQGSLFSVYSSILKVFQLNLFSLYFQFEFIFSFFLILKVCDIFNLQTVCVCFEYKTQKDLSRHNPGLAMR